MDGGVQFKADGSLPAPGNLDGGTSGAKSRGEADKELVVYRRAFAGTPALSIVVPMFNTARYVEQTLNSLSAAGMDGLEFVVVNDGSDDGCENIALDWFKATNAAGALVRTPNRGPSSARNTGLAHATGRYLTFCDSDDLFDAAVHRHMVAVADAHHADQVIVQSVRFDATTMLIEPFSDAQIWHAILGDSDILVTTLAQEPRLMRLEPSPVVRVFRRAFVERIELRFPEGIFFEDLPVHTRAMIRCGTIVLLSNTGLYYRVMRPGQTTSSRGAVRFQMVQSARLAIREARSVPLPKDAGANLCGLIAVMLFWCGEYCLEDDRERYFEAAAGAFAECPPAWSRAYVQRLSGTQRLIMCALAAGDARLLAQLAVGVKSPVAKLRLLFNSRAELYRMCQKRRLRTRASRLLRKIWRP